MERERQMCPPAFVEKFPGAGRACRDIVAVYVTKGAFPPLPVERFSPTAPHYVFAECTLH